MEKLIPIYVLVLALVCSSCDMLNQEPEGSLSHNNFYDSEEDAVAAANAIYSNMRVHQVWLWRNSDAMPSDDIDVPPHTPFDRLQALSDYTFDAENSEMNGIWSNLYTPINRSNAVIQRVPDIEMDQGLKDRVMGEAYFLRGFLYFDLATTYGKVPLILDDNMEELDIEIPASPPEEVLAQIVSDLQQAEGLLPPSYSGENVGRPTNTAASAMLARVHLWQQNWEAAAENAKEVIDSGKYGLFEDFANAFNSLEHENGKEHIWSFQFSSDQQQQWARDFMVPRGSSLIPGGGDAEIVPELEFYNFYDPEDYRRDVSFLSEYVNEAGDTVTYQEFESGVPLIGKYFNPSYNQTQLFSLNRPILRYADVLLMYAEALNELNRTGEAYRYINMVRERARNGDPDSAPQDIPPGSLTQGEFREAVYRERRLELAFEGIRRDDLVRTGRLIEAMSQPGINGGDNIQEHHTRYPIPQEQLDLNPALEQNPGYN